MVHHPFQNLYQSQIVSFLVLVLVVHIIIVVSYDILITHDLNDLNDFNDLNFDFDFHVIHLHHILVNILILIHPINLQLFSTIFESYK